MLSIAEQNQGYINFAIMLENRALKKGITTKWRDFSVVCWRCPMTNRQIGSIKIYLPSTKYPNGKVFRRRSGK